MKVYTCIRDWEAMLTCIYVAWASGEGHKNIRLELEPLNQLSLFDEYIHVDPDFDKAKKVSDSVCRKISPRFYHDLAYSSMAYEDDVLDNIYRVMILGFAYGEGITEGLVYKDIMRHREICKRVGNEAHHFLEFIRFHEIDHSFYVAHIEPKSNIVSALGPHFSDRMPSEYWIIVDDVHSEALIHPKDEPCFLKKLLPEELMRLRETEEVNDQYTDLWRTFFNSVAIEQRKNERCQNNLFPIWKRKHAVEFM